MDSSSPNQSNTEHDELPQAYAVPDAEGSKAVVSSGSTRPSRKSRGKFFIPIVIVALLVIAAGVYAIMGLAKADPTALFNSSIINALSTSSLKQTSTSNDGDVTVSYDLQNLKDIKVFSTASLDTNGILYEIEGFGNMKNTYIRYTKISGEGVKPPDVARLLNKWVSIRVDGQLPLRNGGLTTPFSDPRYLFFGQYIFGNFSAEERTMLSNFISDNNIYEYDKTKVTNETIDGNTVTVYDVTLNTDKLAEYNKMVADMIGLTESDINDALTDIKGITQAKMYINTQDKRLVKVQITQDSQTINNTYSDFNTVTLPAEPTADKSVNDYTESL